AGRVLEEGERVPVDAGPPPVTGRWQVAVDREQRQAGGPQFLGEFGGARQLVAGHEGGGGLRVGQDGRVAGGVLAAARRVQRHRDGPRVQAAEERHHVVQSRRQQ